MKGAKSSKKLKEMPYAPQKRASQNSITPAKKNAPISQTSSERLKFTIQTYQMRNK